MDVKLMMIIIIIKRLCYHAICQMNAIAIAMQAMNLGRGVMMMMMMNEKILVGGSKRSWRNVRRNQIKTVCWLLEL